MKTIRVGSRDSKLAVVQAELVMAAITAAHPELTLELVTMKTTGDKILDRTLDKIGGKGLFVKELDTALLEGRVDITVHSCKDLPMETDPRLPLVAFSRRADACDVLVYPEGVTEPDWSKPVGCSSARRRLQLAELLPHVAVEPVRGNVQTRLGKLDGGQFSALILAGAGLRRLGLEGRIVRSFTPREMLPAAGQGILAVQARAGEDVSFLDCINDGAGAFCATAERAFVARLDGGCSSPVAAHATIVGETLLLEGVYVDERDGLHRGSIRGACAEGAALGQALADRLKEGCAR